MVRFSCAFFLLVAAVGAQQQATVREFTHDSQVMGEPRAYRAMLPPSYASSQKRYPVIYWMHGYETSAEQEEFDREILAYVSQHDVIVVHTGPVETTGEFPLYFPELVEQVDKTLRTVADRDHRAITGFSAGGFLAFWMAGKYPDLVSSASSFMGPTEYTIGPKDFPVECNFDDFYANYDAVRTRLVTGTKDFLAFYDRRLNSVWSYAGTAHETEEFDSTHGAPGIAKTLDFHMAAFAHPLPKPAVFSHADVYPNFGVWGWEVSSGRTQPGITVLKNVSRTGFRSTVREWIPGGATIPEVKLTILTPLHLFPPGTTHAVRLIHLADGKVRHVTLKANAQGRLGFDLDGDAWEVGIGPEPVAAITGYRFADAGWATAGQPVKLRVTFTNKGGSRLAPLAVRWESPNAGVKFEGGPWRLAGLAAGESAEVSMTVTGTNAAAAMARIVAIVGGAHLPLDIPLYPAAQPTKDFQIADGRSLTVYQHATEKAPLSLGEGNGDGFAAPGESFAILLPDGDGYRAAELFTSDPCVDNTVRVSDSWTSYDQSGASVKYSLPRILPACQPGTPIHMLARVVLPNAPNHQVRYFSVEFPVWYSNER